jgi:hypothetical protein
LHLAAPCCAQTAAAGAKAPITVHRMPTAILIDNRANERKIACRVNAAIGQGRSRSIDWIAAT